MSATNNEMPRSEFIEIADRIRQDNDNLEKNDPFLSVLAGVSEALGRTDEAIETTRAVAVKVGAGVLRAADTVLDATIRRKLPGPPNIRL